MNKQELLDKFKLFNASPNKATAQALYAVVVAYGENEHLPSFAEFHNPTNEEVKNASEILELSNVKSIKDCIATAVRSIEKMTTDNAADLMKHLNALVFHVKRYYYLNYQSYL